ncbi:MAG: NifU N-terminal domain-containing protein [Acidimicrobiia bacterium]
MAVTVESTPNPNALKFVVGSPVGGPLTYRDGGGADEWVQRVFALGGVQQVFLTGDFVSVTKTADADWQTLVDDVQAILEDAFGA